MKTIFFIKMHGLGNDFVIIEDSLLADIKDIKSFVIKILINLLIIYNQIINYQYQF